MKLQNFLWHCAGANVPLLSGCASDHSKYSNIGASIVMTAVLAWVSMSFAVYSIFDSGPTSLLVGLIWALMIFVLDRTIVTSMRKPGKVNIKGQGGGMIYGSPINNFAKAGEGFRELLFVGIRMMVAVLVSLVISKPIEVKLFAGRLESVLSQMEAEQAKSDSTRLATDPGTVIIKDNIERLSTSKSILEKRIASGEKSAEYIRLAKEHDDCIVRITPERDNAYRSINRFNIMIRDKERNEVIASAPSTVALINNWKREISIANSKIHSLEAPCSMLASDMSTEKKRFAQQLKDDYQKQESRIQELSTELVEATDKTLELDSELAERRKNSFGNSIIPQIQALEKLKGQDMAMWWASTLITLLFITIELAPVLAKLLCQRGPYDDALEAYEARYWLDTQAETASRINEINGIGENLQARLEAERAAIEQDKLDLLEEREAIRTAKVTLTTKKHAAAIEKELSSYSELVEKIAAAQKEIALAQVELWKKDQLNKLSGKSVEPQP